jgi:glycyl-tRNA synthetase beta chain
MFADSSERAKPKSSDAQLAAPVRREDLAEAIHAVLDPQAETLTPRRMEALGNFLDSEDGRNLLAAYRRANDVVRTEEEQDVRQYRGKPDPQLYLRKEERELAVALAAAKAEAEAAIAQDDFAQAIHAIAMLQPFLDAFFDNVTVNVEMSDRRENRLKLLNEFCDATRALADFSKIAG